jgi:hypothetical protein
MPAPTNTTPGNATVITLPTTITQEAHDGGVTYDLYFTFTATVTGVYCVFGFGGDDLDYRPRVGVSPAPWGSPEFLVGTNRPLLMPVTAGQQYFILVRNDFGDPNPATLTMEIHRPPRANAPARSFVINDDTDGFPAAIVSADQDYTVLRYVHPFPAGEGGDVLASGVALFSDAYAGNLQLFNAQLQSIGTVPFDIIVRPSVRAHHPTNSFYVGDNSNPVVVKNISSFGSVLATHTLTGNNSINGLAANADQSVIYHGRGISQPVRRWVGGTNGTNLAAAEVGYFNGFDIIVLPDDTILVSYFHQTTGEVFVRQYTDGGSLLQTIPIAATSEDNTTARIAFDVTDPDHFYAYWHPDDQTVRVTKLAVDGGGVVFNRDNHRFEAGVWMGDESADAQCFGVSNSCPLLVWPVAIQEVLLDPSIKPKACPPKRACEPGPCCDSGRTLSRGRTGKLGKPVEGSGTPLTPPTSGGRLFNTSPVPTPPERWG